MNLYDGVYNNYEVELGFYRTLVLNEELVPKQEGVRVSVIEIISSADILVETSIGTRAIKAGTIARFEKEGVNIYSLKVLKGSGKIYVNMGLNGLSEEEAKVYSIAKTN